MVTLYAKDKDFAILFWNN